MAKKLFCRKRVKEAEKVQSVKESFIMEGFKFIRLTYL